MTIKKNDNRQRIKEPEKEADTRLRVSLDALINFKGKPKTKKGRGLARRLITPYEPMKGVLPSGKTGKDMALDSGFDINAAVDFASQSAINAAFDEGYAFPGFTLLANWSQIPEFRRPAEIYAREMTRKWLKITAQGEDDKSEKVKQIEDEFKRLNVQKVLHDAILHDGMFGRSQIFFDMGDDDQAELKTPLTETPEKISIGSLKRLCTVEAIWSYPNIYNANDPLHPDFYRPSTWYVMGTEVHRSRLVTIVSRPVPDILKPAYSFAGLSLFQMMKPYVENWLRTRQSVSDLIHAFTVWTLSTDMSTITESGGLDMFFNRLEMFNIGRDNHGVNAINKDTEEFSNVSASLGSLDKLQAQAQEQQCAPSGLPLVYLTGIPPAGLNASSQDEIEIFQDTCAANQEIYSPAVEKILRIVQLSLFGEIDPDIGLEWHQLKVITREQQATIRKTEADTDQLYVDLGVLSPDEVRARIAQEEESLYPGLDLDVELSDFDDEQEVDEHEHLDGKEVEEETAQV
jgi:phage-related protein (TIGR01555 family)